METLLIFLIVLTFLIFGLMIYFGANSSGEYLSVKPNIKIPGAIKPNKDEFLTAKQLGEKSKVEAEIVKDELKRTYNERMTNFRNRIKKEMAKSVGHGWNWALILFPEQDLLDEMTKELEKKGYKITTSEAQSRIDIYSIRWEK